MADDAPPPLPAYPPVYQGSGPAASTTGPVPPPSPSVSTVHFHHTNPSISVSGAPVPASPSSNAADSSDGTAHSGWLHKLGGQVKKFKKRFFRLLGSRFEYFKDESITSRRLGVIPLQGATLVVFDKSIYGESNCFGITPVNSKRTYCIKTDSEADMHRWLSALRPLAQKAVKDKSQFSKFKHNQNAIKEGILEQHRPEKTDKWSERFVVLTNIGSTPTVMYYKEVESTKPSGEISLDNACTAEEEKDVEDAPHAFAISCSKSSSAQKRFIFRAGDEEERKDWIAAIKTAIASAPAPGAAESSSSSSSLSPPPTHQYQNSTSEVPIPLSPSNAAGEIKTIAHKTDAGFQYSESDSNEESDLSIDSESEEDERDVKNLAAQLANAVVGRALPPIPESKAQAPSAPAAASSASASSSSAAASSSSSSSSVASGIAPALPAGGNATSRSVDFSKIVKEGFLRKLGAKVKNWKNRYFRLMGYVLTYHENRDSPPLGEIHLSGTLTKAEPDSLFGIPNTFSITQTQAGQRTYYIVADSKEDMDSWIEPLQKRHSFSATGLPLRLNPRVRVNMNLNPDDADLRAIAVNSPTPINSSYISTDADRKEHSKSSLKGAVSKKKRRFVMDGFDLDLCLANGTMVRRFGGAKDIKVEDIQVGEQLVGSAGAAVRARKVIVNCESDAMFRVQYAHGSHTVTPNHLVVLQWQHMPAVTVQQGILSLKWYERSTLSSRSQSWSIDSTIASGQEKEFALWWLEQEEMEGRAQPLYKGDTVIQPAHALSELLKCEELRDALVIPMHRDGSMFELPASQSASKVAPVAAAVSEAAPASVQEVAAFASRSSTPVDNELRQSILSMFDSGLKPLDIVSALQGRISSAAKVYRVLQGAGRAIKAEYRDQTAQSVAMEKICASPAQIVSFQQGQASIQNASESAQADVMYMMHDSSSSMSQLQAAWSEFGCNFDGSILIREMNPLSGDVTQAEYDAQIRSDMTVALLSKPRTIVAFGTFARERWMNDAHLLTCVASVEHCFRADNINRRSMQLTLTDGSRVQVIFARHPSLKRHFDSLLEVVAEAHNCVLDAQQISEKTSMNWSVLQSCEEVEGGLFTKIEVDAADEQFILSDGAVTHNTYITNRIIAMGFPSDGTEAIYRNDMTDVQRFFNTRHADHYKVYNLCSERKYDHSKFDGRVLEFPFDDHNCVAVEDIPFFCKDVADFLSSDEKNVVVIHCKAGKGRTGLLICIFLLYCGEWQTASEALRYYAFARTQNQKGVTIASQIRWVHYWEKYLHLSREGIGLPKLEPLAMKKMVFGKKSPSFDFFVASCHGEIWSSKDKDLPIKIKENKLKDGAYELEFIHEANPGPNHMQPFVFLKDFQFEFFKGKLFGGSARVMSFWLHTQFLAMEPNYYLKMERMDIDKVSKTKGIPDFTLELFLEPVTTGRKVLEAKEKKNDLSTGKTSLDPSLPPLPASTKSEDVEMLSAALTMMLEGRKMTRFYLGNKELKEKEVEKREVFVFIKADGDSDKVAQLPNEQRTFTLYWSLDSQQLGGGDKIPYEKLALRDIDRILIGKQSDIWGRNVAAKQAAEDRCFSVVPRDGSGGVELHLEGFSDRQLALWMEGFKYLINSTGGAVKEEEGDAFQQSLLALTAGKASAAASSPSSASSSSSAAPAGAGASEGPRERCETFSRPPPIVVPVYKSKKSIHVQFKA